jgi:hypothetical protein
MTKFVILEPVHWPQRRGQGRMVAPLLALTGVVGLSLHSNRCDGERQKWGGSKTQTYLGFVQRGETTARAHGDGPILCSSVVDEGSAPVIFRWKGLAGRHQGAQAMLLDPTMERERLCFDLVAMASPSQTRLASSGFSNAPLARRTRRTTSWRAPLAFHSINLARMVVECHARGISRVWHSLMICGWNSRPSTRRFIGSLLQLVADAESVQFQLKSDSNSRYMEIESKGGKRQCWLRLRTNPVRLGWPMRTSLNRVVYGSILRPTSLLWSTVRSWGP